MVHYQLENDQPSQQSRDNHRLAAFKAKFKAPSIVVNNVIFAIGQRDPLSIRVGKKLKHRAALVVICNGV